MPSRRVLSATLTIACSALAGCVAYENDSPALSDGTLIPTATDQATIVTYTEPDAPSVAGIDRSNWPATRFSVPQRDVVHQPTYLSKPVALTDSSATQRGEYPQPETAGENVTGDSENDQRLEALLMPLQALSEVVLMIPRAIFTPPNTTVRGPTIPIHRAPPHLAALNPVAAPPAPTVVTPAPPAQSTPTLIPPHPVAPPAPQPGEGAGQ